MSRAEIAYFSPNPGRRPRRNCIYENKVNNNNSGGNILLGRQKHLGGTRRLRGNRSRNANNETVTAIISVLFVNVSTSFLPGIPNAFVGIDGARDRGRGFPAKKSAVQRKTFKKNLNSSPKTTIDGVRFLYCSCFPAVFPPGNPSAFEKRVPVVRYQRDAEPAWKMSRFNVRSFFAT